jgi:hypothetical protein
VLEHRCVPPSCRADAAGSAGGMTARPCAGRLGRNDGGEGRPAWRSGG